MADLHLGGGGTTKTEGVGVVGGSGANTTIKYKAITDHQVLREWRLADAQTELLMQRLRWYQSWVRDPNNHSLEIASVFGKMAVEGHLTIGFGG